jgi:exostosin family protein
MRVHIPRLGLDPSLDGPVETLERLSTVDRFREHELVEDPATSDLILFCQCHMLPRDWRLTTIREHPLATKYRDRVLIYDERDRPWCAFPGIYVSMPARSFDPRFQRSWGYFPPTEVAEPVEQPDILFSFIGSPSSRCRRALFELRHPDAVIEEVRRFTFYDPSSPDFERRRQRFRSVMSRSRFVLCPRGRGTSSIRLYEALAHGCVPVIISDGWVAPDGSDWESFSIRWPERDAEGLVGMLEDRDADWPQLSRAARTAYEEFFAPSVWFHRIVEGCSDLLRSDAARHFPREGIRNRAFLAAGADVARWRAVSSVRRTGKRTLQRVRIAR